MITALRDLHDQGAGYETFHSYLDHIGRLLNNLVFDIDGSCRLPRGKGGLRYRRGQRERHGGVHADPFQKGDIIASGDAVVTGKGRAQLKLTDGGFVALDPNTEYVIEDYRFDQASSDSGRSFFNLVRGGVRFVTGAIGKVKRKNWRMRTAVATIGIQGTGVYARYGDDSLKDLFVDVSEGTLEATAVRSAMDVSGSSSTPLTRR